MNDLHQFELLQDLRPFGTARATVLRWNGRRYVRSEREIELCEFIGAYGYRGDRGYAHLVAESGKWEAVGGLRECVATWIPH